MILIRNLTDKLLRWAESVKIKNILSKVLGGGILLFITFTAITLSIENYRAQRSETPSEPEMKTPETTENIQALETETEEETTLNPGAVQNTDVLIEQIEGTDDESGFPFANDEYEITWEDYDAETCRFFKVNTAENEFIPDFLNIQVNEDSRKAMFVIMGYIFAYTEDGDVRMLSHSGEELISSLHNRKFQMQNQRDKNGNPVVVRGDNYRVFDPEEKIFVETDFDPLLDNRGFAFSYSRNFGEPVNSNLVRFYSETYKKWGYKDAETDEIVIFPAYDEAYNFNNGYAVAIRNEYKRWRQVKRMYFIDETGEVLNSSYFPPDTLNKSQLGFLYFDHGLTRALARNYTWTGIVLDEFSYLCYPDGTIFQTPPDYTLIAYSNGMILLEKAGKYGFMDYLGNWVVHPIYSYANPFNEGVAVVGLSDTQKALIDTKGNFITAFDYQHITDCSDGIVAMYSDSEGWTILNKMKLR